MSHFCETRKQGEIKFAASRRKRQRKSEEVSAEICGEKCPVVWKTG
jgi:hypothetical protein